MKWVCFSKFYNPLGNWPWLRISPQSSLYVIYCLILTAWQWLMNFTCIPVQIEPNKSPLRKRLLVLLLWEISHLSSPSRSCLGRLILIHGRQGALRAKLPHNKIHVKYKSNIDFKMCAQLTSIYQFLMAFLMIFLMIQHNPW